VIEGDGRLSGQLEVPPQCERPGWVPVGTIHT
jgi:hypothetical protein